MTDVKNKTGNVMSSCKKTAAEQEKFEKQVTELKRDYEYHLRYTMAASDFDLTDHDRYMAFSRAIRDRLMQNWIGKDISYHQNNVKEVYYLSLEFLIGRILGNNVMNLGLEDVARAALDGKEMQWDRMRSFADDPGLGNGGLGRLAACFLDSMATLDLPCMGYGLRYDYGIFKQRLVNGMQVEEPDNWCRNGYPWEVRRIEASVYVQFGGKVEFANRNGNMTWTWQPSEQVIGVPYDIPIVGYGGKTVNTLRLWHARADNEFSFQDFNSGSYNQAVEDKVQAENLTKVLYPNDSFMEGKELRLRQQYFFVACSVRDILRRFLRRGNDWKDMPDKVFIQLNDTHPTLVIPELMRILMDENGLGWDEAWDITSHCVGYTNHTILPEALEKWSLPLFERLLPRHLQIIYEINSRFLQKVSAVHPGDVNRLGRMSIIEGLNHDSQMVRMANLAVVGSCKVNGVSEIHTHILKNSLFRDFVDMWPDHFLNVTNGITQRRWLLNANPGLAKLITDRIGSSWITNLSELQHLEKFIEDEDFLTQLHRVKLQNKKRLIAEIQRTVGVAVNVDSIFDVQVKRIHEYKRQLLLALYIIILYNRLCDDPKQDIPAHTFIFAGKAAPGYAMAKLIIRLIDSIGNLIASNPQVSQKLKVVFLPDYRVSLAEIITPAADISEQISLAGTEASGTGNMKMMLNGAITLGTMDGANVEIHQEVGPENIFIFGMSAEEVNRRRASYSPWDIYHSDQEIRRAIDNIRLNVFSMFNPGLFDPIVRNLLDNGDYYMILADLRSYCDTQDRVAQLHRQPRKWAQTSLINIAHSGKFSSDRTISNYAHDIWGICPTRD